MNLYPSDYILGYWIATDDKNNNWYMIIKRDKDGVWSGEYTFRYDKGTHDVWDGKDEKSRYKISYQEGATEEEILEGVKKLFAVICMRYSAFNDHFLIRGDLAKFTEIAKTKDYMHYQAGH